MRDSWNASEDPEVAGVSQTESQRVIDTRGNMEKSIQAHRWSPSARVSGLYRARNNRGSSTRFA